jgi:hypothetical protein
MGNNLFEKSEYVRKTVLLSSKYLCNSLTRKKHLEGTKRRAKICSKNQNMFEKQTLLTLPEKKQNMFEKSEYVRKTNSVNSVRKKICSKKTKICSKKYV